MNDHRAPETSSESDLNSTPTTGTASGTDLTNPATEVMGRVNPGFPAPVQTPQTPQTPASATVERGGWGARWTDADSRPQTPASKPKAGVSSRVKSKKESADEKDSAKAPWIDRFNSAADRFFTGKLGLNPDPFQPCAVVGLTIIFMSLVIGLFTALFSASGTGVIIAAIFLSTGILTWTGSHIASEFWKDRHSQRQHQPDSGQQASGQGQPRSGQ